MPKHVVIIGGGTAGWLTAAALARALVAYEQDGVRITLCESEDIGILGVGEGTFPTIRQTLARIGIEEGLFMRGTSATFKQGIRFVNWEHNPGSAGRDHYFHLFNLFEAGDGLDLVPYWLLGCAGSDVTLADAITTQGRSAAACRAPKRISDPAYQGPMNYAYHFDAGKFAGTLKLAARALGVRHIVDTVNAVNLDESGALASVSTQNNGLLSGDLFVDCTGFRAELIGRALKVPFRSCRDALFCDRAWAMQVPYDRPDAPIPSYTISTAHEAGWTWEIGLDTRRGIGYVFSSQHTDDARAEQVLRDYIGPAAEGRSARLLKFDVGFREAHWVKNCVAVGLSSGFFEPLESTGIVLVEVAASLLARLFPWAGDMEGAAKDFNAHMMKRYERIIDFLKLHYCLTKRVDTAFWRDNIRPETIPDSLRERLERWRHRVPSSLDFESDYESFTPQSYQYILYGMGFRTDLRARAPAYRMADAARRDFQKIRQFSERAAAELPSHRALIEKIYRNGLSGAL